MAMIPTAVLPILFSGLFSVGIIGGAIYLLREWYRNGWVYNTQLDRSVFAPDIGFNAPTALLVPRPDFRRNIVGGVGHGVGPLNVAISFEYGVSHA